MSINLHISFDCEEFDIHQTQTHITYMCLTTDKGYFPALKGKKARAAVNRYMFWVSRNLAEHNDHLQALKHLLETAKKVKAFAQ